MSTIISTKKIIILKMINFLIEKEKIIFVDNIRITYSNIHQNFYSYISNILISELIKP